ncbi:MAG: hypothetical protein ACK4MT_11180, partial [Thermaurantiacus tibetensis]
IAARSRLIIHAAPHGTVSLAALAGLPQFAVPQHLEQIYNARQAAAQGILAHAEPGSPDLLEQILAASQNRIMAARAADLSATLRRQHPPDPIAVLGHRLRDQASAVLAEL